MERLRALGLVKGKGALPRSVLQACDEGRLVGGLSLALDVRIDEVLGPLTAAMGGAAAPVRVLDVRAGRPTKVEVEWGEGLEVWTVEDVPDLVDQLNERFIDEAGVKVLVLLGEHEDMLQVWALREDVLEVLLSTSLLDGAWNGRGLRRRFDGGDDEEE